jgi:hypothetical protein
VGSCNTARVVAAGHTQGAAANSVAFTANIPALGFATFFVVSGASSEADAEPVETPSLRGADDTLVVSNGIMSVTFDKTTGRMTTIANAKAGVTQSVSQEWMWYESSVDSDQSSGASCTAV